MSAVRRRILVFLCLCNVVGLLTFGLWPFHVPVNRARWLADRDGLYLPNRDTIRTEKALTLSGSAASLELWLEPEEDDSGTILSFFDPETRRSFLVRQEDTDLVLEKRRREPIKKTPKEKVNFDELLPAYKPVFLTVSSTPGSTAVYANGSLVKRVAGFSFSCADLARILIVGDSTGQRDGWSGEFRGLAIYSTGLTASQARAHFESWTTTGHINAANGPSPAVVYYFGEHQGKAAHSTSSTGDELLIPDQYSILDKTLLETPWNAFYPDLDYFQDVVINIGGFIPLGVLAAAYFSSIWPNRAALAAILLGGAISLTIESLQWFLPTRDSDMTDILTNTLGTWVGVVIFRSKTMQRVLDYFLALGELILQKVGIAAAN